MAVSLRIAGRYVMLLLLAAFVSACAAERPYWAIRPTWDVRNSPIPVPDPRIKPRVPVQRAATPQPQPVPAPNPAARSASASSTTVEVRKGDTVYGISRKNGIPLRDLIAVNDLRPPYTLSIGQALRLPMARFHVVARGDTTYGISRQYGVDLKSLVEINRLRPPYRLAVGQRLQLPGGARTLPINRRAEAGKTPAAPLPAPTARSARGFIWPVSGPVISSFGPKDGGLHNDGINIRADRGTPVRATEAGVVAFAGDGLRGYGNLLLVRHADGWVSAYAHNATLLVSRGDSVKQGQVIARVGDTGGVTDPQLHFELRRGTTAIDPLRVLRQQRANAN